MEHPIENEIPHTSRLRHQAYIIHAMDFWGQHVRRRNQPVLGEDCGGPIRYLPRRASPGASEHWRYSRPDLGRRAPLELSEQRG